MKSADYCAVMLQTHKQDQSHNLNNITSQISPAEVKKHNLNLPLSTVKTTLTTTTTDVTIATSNNHKNCVTASRENPDNDKILINLHDDSDLRMYV